MNGLHTVLRSIYERLQEHDRRLAGNEMRGKVKEVDAKKALVRVAIGKDDTGGDVLSPWLPYKQAAGALKIHSAPSVGQTMAIRSETGDIQQGVAEPFHWNNDNKAPSEKGDEHILTFGDVKMTLIDGGFTLGIGGTNFKFSADGFIQNGGKIEHDGHLVDKDHVHTEVVAGAALSGPPK